MNTNSCHIQITNCCELAIPIFISVLERKEDIEVSFSHSSVKLSFHWNDRIFLDPSIESVGVRSKMQHWRWKSPGQLWITVNLHCIIMSELIDPKHFAPFVVLMLSLELPFSSCKTGIFHVAYCQVHWAIWAILIWVSQMILWFFYNERSHDKQTPYYSLVLYLSPQTHSQCLTDKWAHELAPSLILNANPSPL